MVKIVIGLCTFNRHEQLKEALDSLVKLNLPDGVEVEFILVDNDANGGAEYIFDAYAAEMPFKSHYFVEKNRGLAKVRNRVIDEAMALNATAIAMFDDDEIVSDSWLIELYKVFSQSKVDGVHGTVYRSLPIYSSPILKRIWLNSSKSEAAIHVIGTNNCLFSADLVRADGKNIRFSEEFNFSGREDAVFSFDAQLKGATFRSAPNAIVIEKFPPARSTFRYLFKRWFEAGVSDVAIAKHYKFGIIRRTLREAFFSIPIGLAKIPFAMLGGLRGPIDIALQVIASCGWLCGVVGKTADYYLAHRD
ncbi:MAG: glycosyltransferase [Puniceicoccales bacterium]|jgi:glycosyltransferase involved in cell wall biosynthesis|nr:glycosyltransferase [Puniceicoccales bacterium]